MDKITSEGAKDLLYTIKEIMKDHNLTLSQAVYLMCSLNNIEFDITFDDLQSLVNKSLVVSTGVNATLLFHLKAKAKEAQTELVMTHESKPKGTEFSLKVAEKIEKEFVIDKFLTDEEKKYIADTYFKGDIGIARYFIIFKSLFPVKSKKKNAKWNKKFGFVYDKDTRWDSGMHVAKKFQELFHKKDIGVLLEATYMAVKDSVDLETESCYMTKPFKFLTSCDDFCRDAKERIEQRAKKGSTKKETKNDLNV